MEDLQIQFKFSQEVCEKKKKASAREGDDTHFFKKKIPIA